MSVLYIMIMRNYVPESYFGHLCVKDVIEMKRTLGILFAVVAVLVFALASCSNDVAPLGEGTLVINIGGGQERGVQPAISMNTASFALTVTDSLDDNVIDTVLGANTQSVDYKLPAGSYVVKLDAKNSSGDVIGTGSERVTVVPGGTNTITITVREVSGNGTFAISITANDGYGLALKVYNLLDEEKYSGNLVYSEGKYTTDGVVALANGFYRFEIKRTDTNAVVKSDSLRIVKDMTSGYSARFTFTTDGGITIVNEVLSIPVISISLNKEVLTAEETLVAQAQISGIDDYEVLWYVDGVAQGSDFGTYADLELPLTGKEAGTHEVALYVKNSSVIWAESKSFSIGNGAGRAISLSNLAAGGSIEVNGLDADTELALSGFSLEDGVYIEVVDDGSRGISRGIVDDVVNLFRRQNGTIIPIPDSNGCAEFVAGALGVVEDAKVVIHKLDKLDLDYEIDPKEKKYEGYDRKLAEEYYYINFLLPEFWDLDPEEIVIVTSGSVGAQGVSLLQNGYLNRNVNGVFDLSNKSITGFAVNMHRVLEEYGYNEVMRLHVLNPIHVGDDPTVIDNDINVIRVDKKDAQQYKVTISFTGSDAEDVICRIADEYQCLGTLPRYTDGSHRSMVYPEYDPEGKTITYHLGVVDRDFIFTLIFDSALTGFTPGNASISLSVDTDGIEIHDLDEIDEIDFVADAPGYITWAYSASDQSIFDFERKNGQFNGTNYCISKNGVGSCGVGDGTIRIRSNNNDEVSTGFFLIKYFGNENDVTLFSMIRSGLKSLDCLDVEWDPETEEYVCIDDDCEYCSAAGVKKRYSGYFVFSNYEKILGDTTYWTADEYGEYGKIGFKKGGVRISASFHLDTGTAGNGRKAYGMSSLSWNSKNTDQQVEVCLTKILKSQNKIVCAIAFGGTTDFVTGVELFGEEETTEWEYNDGYVTRTASGQIETRHAIETQIGPGGPYEVVVTGSVIIAVQSLNFEQTYTDGVFMTDTLPASVPVLFIAPDSDTDIEITSVEGNTYNIRSFTSQP